MQTKKITLILGSSFLAVHTVVLAFCFFYSQNSREEAPMIWLILVLGDFPASAGMFLPFLDIQGNYNWNNVYLPAIYFGLIGSVWWFFLPAIVTKVYSRFKNKSV
ncbi:hypothetical protein MLD52_22760 [Puniceicoccaceae bacterium K14]|nr:hypothetical protein [Puniceicoccaceae bacterium K14]